MQQQAPQAPRRLLSFENVADRLGVSVRTLKQALADGMIEVEPIELGPRIHRFTEEDFDTIVAAFPRRKFKPEMPPELAAAKLAAKKKAIASGKALPEAA
jgi:hypothetical protein